MNREDNITASYNSPNDQFLKPPPLPLPLPRPTAPAENTPHPTRSQPPRTAHSLQSASPSECRLRSVVSGIKRPVRCLPRGARSHGQGRGGGVRGWGERGEGNNVYFSLFPILFFYFFVLDLGLFLLLLVFIFFLLSLFLCYFYY